MSGVNSIAGLNKVNVDYRPEVDPAGIRGSGMSYYLRDGLDRLLD